MKIYLFFYTTINMKISFFHLNHILKSPRILFHTFFINSISAQVKTFFFCFPTLDALEMTDTRTSHHSFSHLHSQPPLNLRKIVAVSAFYYRIIFLKGLFGRDGVIIDDPGGHLRATLPRDAVTR